MLPANANPQQLDPLYALAVAIQRQRDQGGSMPDMERAFSTPGQGLKPPPGQLGPIAPPDPGPTLKVPDSMNPDFPASPAPAPQPMPQTPPMPMPRSGLPSASASPPPLVGNGGGPPVPPNLMLAGQDQPGPLGRMMAPGMRNGIVDALAALGGLDSNANPLQALGQTFGAGMASKQAREDRKAGLAGAQYDREHEAYREQVGDRRAAASDTRDEKRLSIEERKAATEERRAQLQDIQIAAGIEHTQAETNKIEREYAKGGLTTDQMLKVENQVTDYGKTLVPSGVYMAIDPTSEQGKNIKKSMDDYRSQLIQSLTNGSGAGAPSEPGGEAPMNSPPAGQGTWDAPITFPGASLTREAIEKLPKGTIFVGPDGQKMERQ